MDSTVYNREELLNRLHSISFHMDLTALPSEGAMEVSVVSSRGTSYYWEGFDDFVSDVYLLKGISQKKIATIKEHISTKTFFIEDLNRTQLKKIICTICKEDGTKELSDIFVNFLELPDKKIESLYCYVEGRTGTIYVSDTEEKIADILNDRYYVSTPWENCSDEHLAALLRQYEGSEATIPFAYFE